MLITADQIRAARALKNWSQTDLAERTGLAVPTIANIELGKQMPGKNTIEKIVSAFSASGIAFLQDEGVQKVKSQITVYRGRDGFVEFMQSVDQMAMDIDADEFLVSNVNEQDFVDLHGMDHLEQHADSILKTKIKYKIMIEDGDTFMPAHSYAEYRWTPKELFLSVPFYVFGDKVGIIGFENDDVNIYVIQDVFISKLYRRQFQEIWERSKKPTKNVSTKASKTENKKGRK